MKLQTVTLTLLLSFTCVYPSPKTYPYPRSVPEILNDVIPENLKNPLFAQNLQKELAEADAASGHEPELKNDPRRHQLNLVCNPAPFLKPKDQHLLAEPQEADNSRWTQR